MGIVQDDGVSQLKMLRVVRCLRMLKLVRIIRASRVVNEWKKRTSLPFAVIDVVQFTVAALCLSHWTSCLWGLVALTTSVPGSTWLDSLVDGGKLPENYPDYPLRVWVAGLYYATVTITTVGYGDVTPQNSEE